MQKVKIIVVRALEGCAKYAHYCVYIYVYIVFIFLEKFLTKKTN
jgi:hypothetical protein